MGGNYFKIGFLTALIAFCVLSCTKRIYVPVTNTTTITERVVDTIVKVQLKIYRDTITTPDTISHLSNPYAESYARLSGGMLHHSLNSTEKPIEVKVVYKDVIKTDSVQIPVEVEKLVYKEKELNTWQKTRMRAGEIAIGSVLLLIVFWIVKKRL